MISEDYKEKVAKIIEKAKEKNLITSYTDFCKTKESDKLSEE